MSMIRSFVRAAGAFALVGVAASCDHDAQLLLPATADPLFGTYVAIGNSITAGYQSDGIDSTSQSQSFAVLLGRQMRTRFAFPALAGTGCPPRIINWTTGARTSGGTSTTCALRNSALATYLLNNVAVPGAGSSEVNAPGSTSPTPPPYANILTTLFLGGETQIQRAVEADPTFVTMWIGNNDVLQAAISGFVVTPGSPRPVTPVATFTANYEAATDALIAGAPDVKGVLIGVVQTANAPILFPVAVLQNPAFLAGFSQAAGGTVTLHPNCTGSTSLISFAIVPAMRAGTHPRMVVCQKNTPGVPAPVGEAFILDTEDQTVLAQTVEAYNDFIEAKATELEFAYWDPNTLLQAQRVPNGCIALFPDLAANPTTGAPFGTCISYDGIHPAAPGHVRIANALIDVINQKYPTTLTPLPVP